MKRTKREENLLRKSSKLKLLLFSRKLSFKYSKIAGTLSKLPNFFNDRLQFFEIYKLIMNIK